MNYHNDSLDISFIISSLNYFIYPKFCLISLLQSFFLKRFNNLFTAKVSNYIRLQNSIFNYFNQKIFFWSIWKVAFCKYFLYFDILRWSSTLKLGPFWLLSLTYSVYMLAFTSVDFILIVPWYVLCYQWVYQYAHLSIMKSYMYRFFPLTFF